MRRETEEVSSPSADAVSEKILKETAPMILARWKTAAYKGSSAPRKLAEVIGGNESFDDLDNGRGLQTPKGKHQKGFDEWTNVGGRRRQRMSLDPTPGHRETSDGRFS